MKKIDWKQYIPDVIILVVFIIASMIYFSPALEGKIIYAVDNINGKAAANECAQYAEQGGNSFWTGSMFSGMPNYQIGGGHYLSQKILRPCYKFFHWGHRNTIFILLFYLVAFYVLLRSLRVNKWISMAGAFAIALSSYFLIIVAAQHHAKCTAIAWMTVVIAAFNMCFDGKYARSAVLTMFFIPMGFFIHPQMSYYICMLIALLYCAQVVVHIKERRFKELGIATAVFVASFAVGMGIGSSNIFANTEYAAETMRGGHSDLEKVTDEQNKTKGLDLDYATAWSYGKDETMTLLIPNFMGGASGYNVGKDSELYRRLVAEGVPAASAKQFCESAPTYRGEKAFTSGPVYIGAIICFLFILGLLIVDGPYKWALFVATLFSILLAWGHNMMWLTEFFFKYFPMYNKFRAVESILIVAEISMPVLGVLALKQIAEGKVERKRLNIGLGVSVGITAGLCLLFALFPSTVDFTSSYDAQWSSRMPEFVYDAVLAQRKAMLQADAWRSFAFIVIGAAAVYLYSIMLEKNKDNNNRTTMIFGIVLTALIVADMWPVDKRFCNDSQFVSQKDRDKAFRKLPYENELLADPTHFRVLNLTTNTFNEARTSYYLKSIGGYSAAKLRRYQDLIDHHIAPEMNPLMHAIYETQGFITPTNADSIFPVLNMLNMKYAIVGLQGGQQIAVKNPYAMGNAWFVDDIVFADNANDEIDALSTINLHNTAVTDRTFESAVTAIHTEHDPSAQITLTEYTPESLRYETSSAIDKTAVLSEIYYPHGWKATIDGQETDIFRVNYMLRAVNLPAGKHILELRFAPDSVKKGNILSMICIIIMLLTMTGYAGWEVRKSLRKINS
ncbi:MAG: YfhO family protein [Paludibacteraceae bacterium]|nr:YfhO family protein [Paludibacteraceae bacterium]